MGYLSQRKNKKRLDAVLNSLIILFGFITIAGFVSSENNFWVRLIDYYRLHFYVVILLSVLFAFYRRYFGHCAILIVCVVFNYFFISSSANIFWNEEIDSVSSIKVEFVPEIKEQDVIGDENAGMVHFNNRFWGYFYTIEKNFTNYTVLIADFRGIRPEEYKNVFDNLAEFVRMQDNSVIVVGDLGIPAWMDTFKEFLNKTELQVKNRIVFENRYKIWKAPTINVLAYKNVGINDITYEGKNILFDLAIR